MTHSSDSGSPHRQQRRQWEALTPDTQRSLRIVIFGTKLALYTNPPPLEQKADLINALLEADGATIDRLWQMLPAELQTPRLAEIEIRDGQVIAR